MNALSGTIIIINAAREDASRYARMLRAGISESLDIAAAATIDEGVALCREGAPHCVLLAHEPPSVDGMAFVASLKFAHKAPFPPTVMITGDGAFNVGAAAARREVDVCIAKSDLSEKLLVHAVDSAARMASLRREVDDLRAELTRLQLYDPVTELASRRLFEDRVGHAVDLARRTGESLSVLHVRLGGLREAHEKLGLTARDSMLREAGARLTAATRQADVVARFAEDEFAVLMESGAGPVGAGRLAERIAARLAEPFEEDGGAVALSVEIGQSHLMSDGDAPAVLAGGATLAGTPVPRHKEKPAGRRQLKRAARRRAAG